MYQKKQENESLLKKPSASLEVQTAFSVSGSCAEIDIPTQIK